MKKRIDVLLVEKGLTVSRERAQSLIMAGHVLVNDVPVTKAGQTVEEDAAIRIRGEDHPVCLARRNQAGSGAWTISSPGDESGGLGYRRIDRRVFPCSVAARDCKGGCG